MKSIDGVTSFDTNAQWIVIDNRCLGCISHVKSSFIGRMQPTTQLIKDSQDRERYMFGSEHSTGIGKMTMVPRTHSYWDWEDDNGATHTFFFPNCPRERCCPSNPHNWTQSQAKNPHGREGCGKRTKNVECLLCGRDDNTKVDQNGKRQRCYIPDGTGIQTIRQTTRKWCLQNSRR
jgi:hypothetical protein